MLKKTGTYLQDSAADHARLLGKSLQGYEVDQREMKAFLPPNRPAVAVNIERDDSLATKVVEMDVDDELLASLKRELVLRSKIDAAISDMAAGRKSSSRF